MDYLLIFNHRRAIRSDWDVGSASQTEASAMKTLLLIGGLALALSAPSPDGHGHHGHHGDHGHGHHHSAGHHDDGHHHGRSGEEQCTLERRTSDGQDCILEPECSEQCRPGEPVSNRDQIT